jgi:hypothetical protein
LLIHKASPLSEYAQEDSGSGSRRICEVVPV